MLFEVNVLSVIVMALLGGMSAYLANQNIAVFHDGLRPVYPQYFNQFMDRKALFATSFSLSFGLVIGFGIPTSIAGKIIIIHTILLAGDIIGTVFKEDIKGKIGSGLLGAGFAVTLMFGMQAIMSFFAVLPVNFTGDLGRVGDLIIIAFCVFPAVAIGLQAGVKSGLISIGLIMLIKQVVAVYGKFSVNGVNISLNADGMALLFGIVAMIFVAARKGKAAEGSASGAFALFTNNIDRIKKNMWLLAISGGIVAVATTLLLVAEGPASLALTAEGNYAEAAMVALGRTLGFIPLVMTTAILSGVYSPAGTKAVHVPAILLINMGILGLVGSFVIGSLIMCIEVLLLGFIAKGMDKFPGMKELGDNTRTAMSKVLDLALLVGGMLAANAIAPTIGYIWVIAIYFLNQMSRKPISNTAIGPIGAISMGLLANILYFLGLFPLPGK